MAIASSRWMARGSSSSSMPNGGAAGPSIAPAAHRTTSTAVGTIDNGVAPGPA